MNIKKRFITLLLIFTSVSLLISQKIKIQESSEEIDFVLQEIEVQEGQTLSYIANYYLKDPKLWPELLKYNKLTTDDIFAPLPGMKLKVPVVLVKEKFRPAYLIYILNQVKYRRKNSVDWQEPTINLELYNDDSIVTYKNSRANIKFYSGEVLSIDENSFVTIRPELKQEEVTLLKGSVRASKSKVITETAVVSPRIDPKLPNTDFRTKVKEDKTTLVEVYNGAVDVTSEGKTVYVPKGFGTEVKPFSPPSPPKELPPIPELTLDIPEVQLTANKELVLNSNMQQLKLSLTEPKQITTPSLPSPIEITQTKKISQEEVSKPKVLGTLIKKYHIQIAKDIEFKKIVYDEISELRPGGKIDFNIAKLGLEDGKYYYKLSYIDELGFENPTQPQCFILDTTAPKLEINLPDGLKTDNEILHINGLTEPEVLLKVNDRTVEVDSQGKFTTAVVLKMGINKINFVAKDKAGNVTQVSKQVELVKTLTKQEKKELETVAESEIKKGDKKLSVTTILGITVSISVILGVLFFLLQ